jgi:L-lysine 6-transaminase
MCALDLPDSALRDRVIKGLRDERVIVLGCGGRSVRLRPALSITEDELGIGLAALDRVLNGLEASRVSTND